jgi:trehalose 6-phosphate synthase
VKAGAPVIGGVPHHRELIEAMLACDLIGSRPKRIAELPLLRRVRLESPFATASSPRAMARARGGIPIGIDPEKFAQLAAKAMTHPDVSRLRREA